MSTKHSTDTEVIEKKKIKEPGRYNVILLNDDHTPMDFVVHILTQIFHHEQKAAVEIMMNIHNKGEGVAGTYFFEIAEQKRDETVTSATMNGYPLQAKLEEE